MGQRRFGEAFASKFLDGGHLLNACSSRNLLVPNSGTSSTPSMSIANLLQHYSNSGSGEEDLSDRRWFESVPRGLDGSLLC